MIIEELHSQGLKGISLIVAWFFAQTSEFGGVLGLAFDQLFSLGLLVLVLIILFREYKSGQKYNTDRDEEFSGLLKENIETRRDFQSAIHALTEVVRELKNK